MYSDKVLSRQSHATKKVGGATNVLVYVVAFLFFFTPANYAFPSSAVESVWKSLTVLIGGIFIIIYLTRGRINLLFAALAAFFASFNLLSSLVMDSDGSISGILFNTLKGIGFCAVAAYGLNRNARNCVKGFIIAGILMCAANYLVYLQYANVGGGLRAGEVSVFGRVTYQHWFLFGSDNASLEYYLPVAACLAYYSFRYNSKWIMPTILFYVLTLAMYVDLQSANALVVFALFGICLTYALYCERFRTKRVGFISGGIIIVVSILFNLMVIIFLSTDVVQNVIFNIFGKSESIISRVIIWENALHWFCESPVFGQGVSSVSTDVFRLTYDHAHNLFLQIIYQGGLVALALFSIVLFHVLEKRRNGGITSEFILACGIAAMIVGGTFEFHFSYLPQFFMVLVYGYRNYGNEVQSNARGESELVPRCASGTNVISRLQVR